MYIQYRKITNDKIIIVLTGYILCLENLDTMVQPVTYIKKAITIKYNATWTIEFTSSPPMPAKGGEEGTRQQEYSNTIVSIV